VYRLRRFEAKSYVAWEASCAVTMWEYIKVHLRNLGHEEYVIYHKSFGQAYQLIMKVLTSFICVAACAQAQLQTQNNTFNSTFTLTAAQIEAANLSSATAHDVEIALRTERTNNAGYLTQDDPFYRLPANLLFSDLPPSGSILKVEEHSNNSLYTIPPTLSLSRFLYVSETLNGSKVPASAYVLWPFTPRRNRKSKSTSPDVYETIGQAHGTSGQATACAPSGLRNLWDDFHGPFAAALAGFAVVATDYVGLGIPHIDSPYFVLPSQANDVFHAVAAAQKHWSTQLSKDFVIMGQSQGGGTTWAGAQRQAQRPVDGYLGTVAASPFTDVLADIAGQNSGQVNARVAGIAQGLKGVRDNFTLSEWLTDTGVARTKLMLELQACGSVAGHLFSPAKGIQFLKPGWNETESATWWNNITSNGERPFAGPMLVLQGDKDGNAIEKVTTAAVKATCEMFPQSKLQYSMYEGVTHSPIMFAAHNEWINWISDRFDGVELESGCKLETVQAGRGADNTIKDQNWFIEYDLY
jgi:pimeloyl-ACP methyl ester carboxylesterase